MQQSFKTGCLEFQVYVYFKTLFIFKNWDNLSISINSCRILKPSTVWRTIGPQVRHPLHVDWVRGNPLQKYTHPETNSLPLKIDPWKGDSELGNHSFLGAMLRKNWPRILFKIVRMKCNYARKFPKLYSLGGGNSSSSSSRKPHLGWVNWLSLFVRNNL